MKFDFLNRQIENFESEMRKFYIKKLQIFLFIKKFVGFFLENMETLWSPWRSQYIESFKDEKKKDNKNCFFCDAVSDNETFGELVIHRTENCIVMLNKYPYNNGHLLIAPLMHSADMTEIPDMVLKDIILTMRLSITVLEEVFKPQGFNIGANLGRVAGAGVPEHLHYHVVPRWNGDTNFMSVLCDIKIVSQSLIDTRKLLSEAYEKKIKIIM